ncbi:YybH family protein [Rhizobium sp.]|uniref:YybH family protein n=1 Tax=Rhizobium sp. TaxID=391 RepID=UPI003F7FCE8D
MTDDEKAIRKVVETWTAASRAGDTATVLGLMTDDVIFMIPGQEPFGKEAFAAASKGMEGMKMEGASEIVELQVLGDWAYIRNHIDMTVTLPDGDAVHQSGYTLTLLRKEAGGEWRLARDANLLAVRP